MLLIEKEKCRNKKDGHALRVFCINFASPLSLFFSCSTLKIRQMKDKVVSRMMYMYELFRLQYYTCSQAWPDPRMKGGSGKLRIPKSGLLQKFLQQRK